MAKAATPLSTWSIKYYETRAIAERALFEIRTAESARPWAPFGQLGLALLFGVLNCFLGKLVPLLTALEAQSSSFLLQGEGAKMPQLLRDLLYTVADILMCTREETLQNELILRRPIARFRELHQRLDGLTERFANAQKSLRSSIAHGRAEQRREALEA
jgi:hypothetical protein